MASSGSFNTSAYNNLYIQFSWSIKSQSTATNKTVINWSATAKRSSGTGGYYAHWTIKIDGTTVNSRSQSDRILITNGMTIASGTRELTHANDGTKTFSASITAAIYTYADNCSGSGSWALTQIPRYATITPSLDSETETSLTLNWTTNATIDKLYYSIDNGGTYTNLNIPEGTAGSFTVSGLTANTGYPVVLKARRKDSQLESTSTAQTFTTYRYPYAAVMPDFNIESNVTVTLFNPLSRAVTAALLASDGTIAETVSVNGTSAVFTGSTTKSALYASIPSAVSDVYSVRVTYGAEVSTESGGNYTADAALCAPVIGSATYADTNATAQALLNDPSQIVQNIGIVHYSASNLQPKNSATIAGVSVAVNNQTYALTVSGTSASGGDAVINSATDVIAVFTLTDSRGFTGTKNVTVTMLEWAIPSAIISFARQLNFYSETDITVDANYSSLDGKNSVTITYLCQAVPITGQTTPADVSGTLSDNVQDTIILDNLFGWNIAITITDAFGGTVTYNAYAAIGVPFVYFDRFKQSVGINAIPTHEKSLEINGDNIYLNGNAVADFPLSVANGGTGATDTEGALLNFGLHELAYETKNQAFLFSRINPGTSNGISWTVDHENQTITLNGTATADVWIGYIGSLGTDYGGPDAVHMRGKEYTLSIIPANTGVQAFAAFYTGASGTSTYTDVKLDIDDSYSFTVPGNATRNRSGLRVKSGTTVNNVTYKLQFQETDIPDKTYTEPALTNLQISNSFIVKRFDKSYTIGGSTSVGFDASFITPPNGYVLIGFVGWSTNAANVIPRSVRYNGDFSYQYSFELRNLSSSSATNTFTVYVLFARSEMVTLDIS